MVGTGTVPYGKGKTCHGIFLPPVSSRPDPSLVAVPAVDGVLLVPSRVFFLLLLLLLLFFSPPADG